VPISSLHKVVFLLEIAGAGETTKVFSTNFGQVPGDGGLYVNLTVYVPGVAPVITMVFPVIIGKGVGDGTTTVQAPGNGGVWLIKVLLRLNGAVLLLHNGPIGLIAGLGHAQFLTITRTVSVGLIQGATAVFGMNTKLNVSALGTVVKSTLPQLVTSTFALSVLNH